MEKKLYIPTTDGYFINSILTTSRKKTNKLVIIIHGLTGHMNEHMHIEAAKFFSKKGYDVLRFNLYGYSENQKKKSRHFFDALLKHHVADVKKVIAYFEKKYRKFYFAGHSYGGLTLAITNPKEASALSFWDPTYDPTAVLFHDIKKSKKYGCAVIDWGMHYLTHSKFVDEGMTYDKKACRLLSKNLHSPTQVIHAGIGWYVKNPESYHSFTNVPTNYTIVKNADHCFYEEGATEALLNSTLKWFRKY